MLVNWFFYLQKLAQFIFRKFQGRPTLPSPAAGICQVAGLHRWALASKDRPPSAWAVAWAFAGAHLILGFCQLFTHGSGHIIKMADRWAPVVHQINELFLRLSNPYFKPIKRDREARTQP